MIKLNIWLFTFQSKSNVSLIVLAFVQCVKKFFSTNIISIQTDWGGKFCPLKTIFQKLGITHRVTCPYSHQQNNTVEHLHRHIVKRGLSLLSHALMPQKYWAEAFLTATFLINHMPTPLLLISPLLNS